MAAGFLSSRRWVRAAASLNDICDEASGEIGNFRKIGAHAESLERTRFAA